MYSPPLSVLRVLIYCWFPLSTCARKLLNLLNVVLLTLGKNTFVILLKSSMIVRKHLQPPWEVWENSLHRSTWSTWLLVVERVRLSLGADDLCNLPRMQSWQNYISAKTYGISLMEFIMESSWKVRTSFGCPSLWCQRFVGGSFCNVFFDLWWSGRSFRSWESVQSGEWVSKPPSYRYCWFFVSHDPTAVRREIYDASLVRNHTNYQ